MNMLFRITINQCSDTVAEAGILGLASIILLIASCLKLQDIFTTKNAKFIDFKLLDNGFCVSLGSDPRLYVYLENFFVPWRKHPTNDKKKNKFFFLSQERCSKSHSLQRSSFGRLRVTTKIL